MNKKIHTNHIDLIFLYLEQGLIKKHLDKLGEKKNKRKEKRTCILIPLVANFFYFLNKGACFFFFFLTLCSANYVAGRATTAQAKAGDDELENN